MAYTTEQLEGIAARLRDLPPIEKKKQVHSKAEAVRFLAKEIAALQKRGYSLDQIAESLRREGLDIATPTLKSYLQRSKQARQVGTSKPKSQPKTDALKVQAPVETARATFTPKADSEEI